MVCGLTDHWENATNVDGCSGFNQIIQRMLFDKEKRERDGERNDEWWMVDPRRSEKSERQKHREERVNVWKQFI